MLANETVLGTPVPEPKRSKYSLLPILTVLFVISYSLFVMLVVEQGNIITSQRWLIKQLFSDSIELSNLKGKSALKHNAEAKTQAQAVPKTQAPIPSIQVPAQEQPKESSKMRRNSPQHPPKPASDSMDVRRSLIAI